MIGIAGRQGNVAEHAAVLSGLGAEWRLVLSPKDLGGLRALVLPGGETTAQRLLWDERGLWDAIKAFGSPILGTCAGAIHLAGKTVDAESTLGMMDTVVERNGWGAQAASFRGDCALPWAKMEALFIRAPRFRSTGSGIDVLATCRGEAVVVRAGRLWASACHPEALGESALHEGFLSSL